jgi:hypothetical protein
VEKVGTLLRPAIFQVKPGQINYATRGDVSIMKLATGHAVVVGSTSSVGGGPKPMDNLKIRSRALGKFLARVVSMDVAATGVLPILVSVTLGVEKEPTGSEILKGVSKEIRVLGFEPSCQILKENLRARISI